MHETIREIKKNKNRLTVRDRKLLTRVVGFKPNRKTENFRSGSSVRFRISEELPRTDNPIIDNKSRSLEY